MNTAISISERLAAGPPRGLGPTHEIVQEALSNPELTAELVASLKDKRKVVTIRAANALDTIQRVQPEVVTKHGHQILRTALVCQDTRTRWNLIEVIGRLQLHGNDRNLAIDLMFEALSGSSSFLRALAMTGLVEYAREDASLMARVRPIVMKSLEDPSPAARARARKLQSLVK